MRLQRLVLSTTIAMICFFTFNATAWSESLSFTTTCPSPWVPTASFDSDIIYPSPGPLGTYLLENEYIFSINSPYDFYIWSTGHTTPLQGLYAAIYMTENVNVQLPKNPYSGQLANDGKLWLYLYHYGFDDIDITVYDENDTAMLFAINTIHYTPTPPATPIDIFNIYIEADAPIARIEYSFPHAESLLIKLCAY